MKAKSTPVRIDADLYETAAEAASVMSRSTSQQIAHWVRIGREVEASPEVSAKKIADVLRRAGEYDDLTDEEQAIVRARWQERFHQLRTSLRLDAKFAAEGRRYATLDEDGNVVVRGG